MSFTTIIVIVKIDSVVSFFFRITDFGRNGSQLLFTFDGTEWMITMRMFKMTTMRMSSDNIKDSRNVALADGIVMRNPFWQQGCIFKLNFAKYRFNFNNTRTHLRVNAGGRW